MSYPQGPQQRPRPVAGGRLARAVWGRPRKEKQIILPGAQRIPTGVTIPPQRRDAATRRFTSPRHTRPRPSRAT